jgi:hypothetical protein
MKNGSKSLKQRERESRYGESKKRGRGGNHEMMMTLFSSLDRCESNSAENVDLGG